MFPKVGKNPAEMHTPAPESNASTVGKPGSSEQQTDNAVASGAKPDTSSAKPLGFVPPVTRSMQTRLQAMQISANKPNRPHTRSLSSGQATTPLAKRKPSEEAVQTSPSKRLRYEAAKEAKSPVFIPPANRAMQTRLQSMQIDSTRPRTRSVSSSQSEAALPRRNTIEGGVPLSSSKTRYGEPLNDRGKRKAEEPKTVGITLKHPHNRRFVATFTGADKPTPHPLHEGELFYHEDQQKTIDASPGWNGTCAAHSLNACIGGCLGEWEDFPFGRDKKSGKLVKDGRSIDDIEKFVKSNLKMKDVFYKKVTNTHTLEKQLGNLGQTVGDRMIVLADHHFVALRKYKEGSWALIDSYKKTQQKFDTLDDAIKHLLDNPAAEVNCLCWPEGAALPEFKTRDSIVNEPRTTRTASSAQPPQEVSFSW